MSAYSPIIEGNTAMARQLRRGELEEPDPDDMADKYELIEELATADGLSWYEVSNWARTEAQRCRHNLARSEEHTSELQSRGHLVCRLLLEKNKENINIAHLGEH